MAFTTVFSAKKYDSFTAASESELVIDVWPA
jgi:hypothetical protein